MIRLLCALLILVAVGTHAAAGQPAYELPRTAVFRQTSAGGVGYEIRVHLPSGYSENAGPYAVLYTLDADYSFAVASNILDHLSERGHIPPHIVVGIAYPDQSLADYRANRSRDYTPVFDPTHGYDSRQQPLSGGAEAFLDYLQHQAIPLVEGRYRVDPSRRTLTGHSYGGLFASWLLMRGGGPFGRLLIVSPSLWYHDHWLLTRAVEQAPATRSGGLLAYFAIGDREEQSDRPMVSDLRRFTDLLASRNTQGLTLMRRTFDDETHASIYPVALSAGIRHLYPADWLEGSNDHRNLRLGKVPPAER